MFYYTIYNRVLASNAPFPELVCADPRAAADVVLRVSSVKTESFHQAFSPIVCGGQETDPDPGQVSVAESATHYRIEYPSAGKYTVDKQGQNIDLVMDEAFEPHLRSTVLNNILGFTLYAGGATVLHGSAVQTGDQGIGFLGRSGAGKSTLASWFLAQGRRLVTDDIIIPEIEGDTVTVAPGYPGIRLWNDSLGMFRDFSGRVLDNRVANRKNSVSILDCNRHTFASGPCRLARLYLLNRGGNDLRIEPVTGHRKFLELYQHVIGGKLILSMPDMRQKIQDLASLAERIELFSLSYPNGIEFLEAVQEAVLNA